MGAFLPYDRTVDLAERLVADGIAPACAWGCAGWNGTSWRRDSGGWVDGIFDLASVTKPMTAVAIARGGVDVSAPLGAFLPEVRGTASEGASLELLLAHRAGLEAHRALYAPSMRGEAVDTPAALRELAGARRPDAAGVAPAGGFDPVYSDLGYILAGAALARATGAEDAGEAIERGVLDPLGLVAYAGTVRGLEGHGVRGPFAPTEDVAWRGGLVSGAVHDPNAWVLTGRGGSGHAGIFATVDAVLDFGIAFLDALSRRGGPLGGVDLAWLVRERPGGTLRAGFDGKSPQGSSAGQRAGVRSFGHLGFTGTSLWMDPDAQRVVVLLTNRVCPSAENVAIRAARPAVHDVLWARALEISGPCVESGER
jgi:CubicO group peptidase (beta-lactamase class C family)